MREQRIARGVSTVEIRANAILTVAMLRGVTISDDVGDKAHRPEDVLRRGVNTMRYVALETFVGLESAHPIL